MSPWRRWHTTACCALAVVALVSCGRIAPWFAPQPPAATGTLIVASVPEGAAVHLDGVPTGHTTPDTLRDVTAGRHVVRVVRAGWAAAPESAVVELAAQAVQRADFSLTAVQAPPPQVVLLEAFSNVSCVGCPQMSSTLAALLAEPGFGPERVLLVKYAANWPALNDPHYQANPADNGARLAFYQPYLAVGIPTLALNGALAGASGEPPALDALRSLVAASLQGDPGFSITVDAAAQSDDATVLATVTLRASRAVARANAVLQFALVQDPVTYRSPPGNQGETEFHDVMRDLVAASSAPLPLAAGDSVALAVSLARQANWPVADLRVIAFVQDALTREVLQAGSAVVTPPPGFARAGASTSASSPGPLAGSVNRHSNHRGRP